MSIVRGSGTALMRQLCPPRGPGGRTRDARCDGSQDAIIRPMAPGRERFDVFCRVVDNFGDAGVALRLSRQLAREHGADVTLWIDDVACVARIAATDDRRHEQVRVRALAALHRRESIVVPDVVVETFGCGIPRAYLDAMELARRPPVWINLEYLSAEPHVDALHALPSPHPQRALQRWFLFPGFTPASGGLLRERDLFAERDRYRADPGSRAAAWTSLGLPAPPADALTVSLFCYPNEALPALLRAWRDDDAPIACIVPEGVATTALERLFDGNVPHPGDLRSVGALTIAVAPFVDQRAFDRRLWTSDLDFVRGEDSFLRAQWAAQPFVWHIYPQTERAHVAKLDAFLDRYTERLDPPVAQTLRTFWTAFNDEDTQRTADAWRPLRACLPALRRHAARWADALAGQRDLATQLVDFARKRL